MDSQLFFYINLVTGIALLLWFLAARRNSGYTPTKLNLRNPDSSPEFTSSPLQKAEDRRQDLTPDSPAPVFKKPEWKPRKKDVKTDIGEDTALRNAKVLNIYFIYNGHDWDAYAVLGLPAGASLPLVTERYQQLIKTADSGQLDFYEAAYSSILKKL